MREQTCCFTGHRVQSLPWGGREEDPRCAALKARMRAAMVELVHTFGVRRFISGMALGVDTYAAELVLDLRAAGEPVSLECAIPFPGQADRWSARDRARYAALRATAGGRPSFRTTTPRAVSSAGTGIWWTRAVSSWRCGTAGRGVARPPRWPMPAPGGMWSF